jgi:hypothetical protein
MCFPENMPEGWKRGISKTERFKRGAENHMRKTPRSKEEVARIIKIRQQNMKENPEKYEEGKRSQREAASCTFKGIPKSAESNAKRSASSKNYITLKSALTGECVRIKREEAALLDQNIWKNPYTLAEKKLGAKWYNNGITERKIFPGDSIPVGFTQGRKKRNNQ